MKHRLLAIVVCCSVIAGILVLTLAPRFPDGRDKRRVEISVPEVSVGATGHLHVPAESWKEKAGNIEVCPGTYRYGRCRVYFTGFRAVMSDLFGGTASEDAQVLPVELAVQAVRMNGLEGSQPLVTPTPKGDLDVTFVMRPETAPVMEGDFYNQTSGFWKTLLLDVLPIVLLSPIPLAFLLVPSEKRKRPSG
ncbi:hypothetical protein APB26_32535 [Pseudomonas aeruginosa]|uniref:hypothetical protein n=1 Tax=Pseudomonas aeruginosa TaxID=287 RepID=UPI00071B1B8A|nr:hypothetical protein [Pseudomonas aeruginosa]KSQ21710.1 hypothetical protein APB26_32535 [Pseudomonas aeruginosa]RPV61382.1 hypothetical protein IPC838_18870 [Pseudomonas aeruginosa]